MCVAEAVIEIDESRLIVTPSLQDRVIILSADDGAAETCVDLPAAKVRRLILNLTAALREIED
ncbi:hypothetical protein [Methylobacterium haplocladii]|uniref:RNA-binding protein n=1 Tax=Methylobacterium haplocladii TaxID=1176176 RepID=A0A512IS53_9HYPH|nr:hypothetical protein [Methylobacterium haplocladii]GEP00538.1 hypothetical protein MHA02_29250 [Methylobacterium haplocladii]GLS57838.1 hypothetical protein GCM10007887_04940 [Methylobacterium haplocladii]